MVVNGFELITSHPIHCSSARAHHPECNNCQADGHSCDQYGFFLIPQYPHQTAQSPVFAGGGFGRFVERGHRMKAAEVESGLKKAVIGIGAPT